MKRRFYLFFVFVGLLFIQPNDTTHAQSLEDELSVLDDLPEADLSVQSTEPSTGEVFSETEPAPFDSQEQSLQEEIASLPEERPAPPSALTGVESEPLAYLTAMDFQQLPDRVRLRVRTDKGIDYQINEDRSRRQVVLELQNSTIASSLLKRALDTGEFDGPVALIKAYESRAGALPATRVLFQLRDNVKPKLTRVGTELLVDFPILGSSNKLFESAVSSNAPVLPETILSSFDRMKFSGSRMNLKVKDAPLPDVLALISKASGQDFVLSKALDTTVTIQMNDSPWDQILAMILLNANMGYQKIGNVYRVAPAEDLRKELEAAIASEKKKVELAPLETRIFAVNYAKADDLEKIVKNFLTKDRGLSSVETRTNSIVVTDVSAVLDRVGTYLQAVDLQTPQVLIEARIVEATDEMTKDLNVQWRAGGDESFVNLNSTNATPSNPAAGIKIANLPGFEAIEAMLNMFEAENKSNTIASPKVMTLDNQKATISDGEEVSIRVPATADQPETTVLKDVVLKLEVTPSVTSDGFVRMEAKLTKDDIVSIEPFRATTKETETTLMVESGKTAVIGGVFLDQEIENEERMSYLGSLPILGRLFTPLDRKRNIKRELLIFISPKVLNADRATLMSQGASSSASF